MTPTLPITPQLITRLAGYAQWLEHLAANNQSWDAQDLQSTTLALLLRFFNGQAPANIALFQVHQRGEDWQGPFDRDSYLCLNEGEARMVVDQLRVPSPKASRLYFEHAQHASYRPITLAEVLASSELAQRLKRRLGALTHYPAPAYEQANAVVFWLDGGTTRNLLFSNDQLIPPSEVNRELLRELTWGKPICVWNSEGLGGVMAADGHFLLPCRYAYLDWRVVGNWVEASVDPLPEASSQPDHWDFLNFRCDVLDIRDGHQVTPERTPVLVNSLAWEYVFVALADQCKAEGRPLLGFMDADGNWLGAPYWADVLLYNDDMAAVQCPDTGLWGYINQHGETAIPPQFLDSNFFNHGLTFVQKPASPADWYAINKQGEFVTGPWRSIDHGRRGMLVVQDAQHRWALLDMAGQIKLAPQTLPDDLDEDGRLEQLNEAYRTQRQALAERLKDAPLAQRVAELNPQSESDLAEIGLWNHKVHVSALPERWQALIDTRVAPRIGWSYPVSGSIFDLAQEAPITFTKHDGSTVTIGIPWYDVELIKS